MRSLKLAIGLIDLQRRREDLLVSMNISTPLRLYCLILDSTNGRSHEYSGSTLAAFQGISNIPEMEYFLLNFVKSDSGLNCCCVRNVKRDLSFVAKGVLRSSLAFEVIPYCLENDNIVALVLVVPNWAVEFIL